MSAKAGSPGVVRKPARDKRLAEELRANLLRRKAQAKSRRAGAADERPDGLNPASRSPDTPPDS
jgi:hypothetical protein